MGPFHSVSQGTTTGQPLWQQKCELIPPSHALGSLPVIIHTPLLLSRARFGLQKALWAQGGLAGWAGTSHKWQPVPWAWTRSPGVAGALGALEDPHTGPYFPRHCGGSVCCLGQSRGPLSPPGSTAVTGNWEQAGPGAQLGAVCGDAAPDHTTADLQPG